MNDDLIKRSDAIKAICENCEYYKNEKVINDIKAIPPADRPREVIAQVTFDEEKLREIVKEAVERFKEEYEIADRPQGEWKDVPPNAWRFNDIVQWHECSACKGRSMFISNYCPNCGARMFAKDTNVLNKKGAEDD